MPCIRAAGARTGDGTHLVGLRSAVSPEPSTTIETSEAIGKLCVGGDRACANGDVEELRDVAYQLADYLPEPMHCEIEALASACEAQPRRAPALWDALKDRIYREVRA